MEQRWIIAILVCELWFCIGCVRKTYVRNQFEPIIDKVNHLDDETARNAHEARDTTSRGDQALSALNTTIEEVASNAQNSEQKAAVAQQSGNAAFQRATGIVTTLSNIDNYKAIAQASVYFSSGEATLDNEAIRTLDEIGARCPNAKHYIVAVEGGSDSTGTLDANYSLSERRAEVVVNYLATKYDIPAFKMHMVGLGADKPIESNSTPAGRAQNRRADVQLLSVQTNAALVPSVDVAPSSDEATDDESDEARR